MEKYIVLIPTSQIEGRKQLEKIENQSFEFKSSMITRLCYTGDLVINMAIDPQTVTVMPITDFMDILNDSDSDQSLKKSIDFGQNWFGYVQFEKNY